MNNPTRIFASASAFVLSALLVAAQASDRVVGVDFNVGGTVTFIDNYNGQSAPVGGAYWNGLSITGANFGAGPFTSSTTLLASDGTTNTTVGFTVTFTGAYAEMRFPGNANYTTSLLEDYAYSSSGQSRQLTITGLQANTSYDLYLYSMNARYGSDTTTFSVTGAYSSSSSPLSKTATNAGDNTTFINGMNYVAFTSVSSSALKSDGSGTLVIDWIGAGEGALNGFQIVLPDASLIPEPGTCALLIGVGGLTYACAARRRRTN